MWGLRSENRGGEEERGGPVSSAIFIKLASPFPSVHGREAKLGGENWRHRRAVPSIEETFYLEFEEPPTLTPPVRGDGRLPGGGGLGPGQTQVQVGSRAGGRGGEAPPCRGCGHPPFPQMAPVVGPHLPLASRQHGPLVEGEFHIPLPAAKATISCGVTHLEFLPRLSSQ